MSPALHLLCDQPRARLRYVPNFLSQQSTSILQPFSGYYSIHPSKGSLEATYRSEMSDNPPNVNYVLDRPVYSSKPPLQVPWAENRSNSDSDDTSSESGDSDDSDEYFSLKPLSRRFHQYYNEAREATGTDIDGSYNFLSSFLKGWNEFTASTQRSGGPSREIQSDKRLNQNVIILFCSWSRPRAGPDAVEILGQLLGQFGKKNFRFIDTDSWIEGSSESFARPIRKEHVSFLESLAIYSPFHNTKPFDELEIQISLSNSRKLNTPQGFLFSFSDNGSRHIHWHGEGDSDESLQKKLRSFPDKTPTTSTQHAKSRAFAAMAPSYIFQRKHKDSATMILTPVHQWAKVGGRIASARVTIITKKLQRKHMRA